jgi:hypothetical protein
LEWRHFAALIELFTAAILTEKIEIENGGMNFEKSDIETERT